MFILKELAAKIKTEIEQGRKAREMHIKSQPLTNKKEKTKDTEEVLLTRTDRFGNVRPLQGREHTESSQPRRREKVLNQLGFVAEFHVVLCNLMNHR